MKNIILWDGYYNDRPLPESDKKIITIIKRSVPCPLGKKLKKAKLPQSQTSKTK